MINIAIRGHESRGKEVIQILESLGGKNTHELCGNGKDPVYHYHIDSCGIIAFSSKYDLCNYKFYTLEEFEKEFPFKIGDLCIYYSGFLNEEIIVKILGIAIENDCIMYEVGHKDTTKAHTYIYKRRHTLKPYKEMKEERNITLTLNKAKEWYQKGGELKEVALQAFNKKELNPLPRSWGEFCINYSIQAGEAIIDEHTSQIRKYNGIVARGLINDKNVCPSQKSAEAHLAMIQLEQLRDCWRQGWKPDWNDDQQAKHCIIHSQEFKIHILYTTRRFLSFPTIEIAEEFLKCFRDLIEKAGDLI